MCCDENAPVSNSNAAPGSLEKSFHSFYINRTLCDYKIIVNEQTFEVHKLILAYHSRYFYRLFKFNSSPSESEASDFTGYCHSGAMKSLINYFYTGAISIGQDNVFDLLFLTSYLLVDSLHQKCCTVVSGIVRAKNLIRVRKLLQNAQTTTSQLKCDIQEHKRLFYLVNSLDFLDLNISELYYLFTRVPRCFDEENHLLWAIYRWVKHKASDRSHYTSLLLSCVKPHCVSISDKLRFKRCLLNLYDDLNEASVPVDGDSRSKYKPVYVPLYKSKLVAYEHFLLTPGLPYPMDDKHHSIIITGGFDGSKSLNIVSAYSFATERTFTFLAPLKLRRCDHATATDGAYMYVVGGFSDYHGCLSSVEVYCAEDNSWFNIPAMSARRRSLAAVMCEDGLYVSGGLDETHCALSSVELYNTEKDSWSMISNMNECRFSHCMASHENHLFAIGGSDTRSAEVYSCAENKWEFISNLPSTRYGSSLVLWNHCLYVIGGKDNDHYHTNIECYDIKNKFWFTIENVFQIPRYKAASTLVEDTIYVFGGKNDSWSLVDSMESYDLTNRNTSQETKNPLPFIGAQCCCLEIPSSHFK